MTSEQPQDKGKTAEVSPPETIESAVEKAKRAFALKQYEQAVDYYATALELVTKQLGEDSPETADLYFSYGRALLENAVAQSSVLGKEQTEEAIQDPEKAGPSSSDPNRPILSFSGDAEDIVDDPPVDLFGKAADPDEEEEEEEGRQEEEEEDGEPEDDFNAAWEVLDLARAIYDKQATEEGDEEIKLKLADTYIALGDVSLETEKFDQAISDYEAGLKLKLDLLPTSSRHIAEAHYKLSIVLDLTSGRLSDAIDHVGKALASVEARLAVLRDGLAGKLPPLPEPTHDPKGKGKSTKTKLVRDDVVQNMSKSHIEIEIKEMEGLREDLALKVEELKTAPNEALAISAPAMAAQALDRELNAATSMTTSSTSAPIINDLTSAVKRRKKAPENQTAAKRKAEGEAEPSNTDKKVRLDTPDA